jgi:histidine triad (HIT) family protein
MASECLFCRIAAGTIPAQIVYQDQETVAFRDINPQSPVHVLVIPRRHVVGLADEPGEALFEALFAAVRAVAAQEGIAESGFRAVINTGPHAQQSVGHLHVHVMGGRPFTWPPG